MEEEENIEPVPFLVIMRNEKRRLREHVRNGGDFSDMPGFGPGESGFNRVRDFADKPNGVPPTSDQGLPSDSEGDPEESPMPY